jgi:iron complex outermembrane receptor protein
MAMKTTLRQLLAQTLLLATMTGISMTEVLAAEPASHDLGTVEVIGKREPVALPLTVDVVDATTIAAQHRDDLAEALDLIPGISVQNLGQRRERLITLRGFSSRQVPLFIDGVPVYVPYDGNVDLARFGVDYVSEIVVGKGLASLLYGPNILGGAVNVISRRPVAPLEVSARVAAEFDSKGSGVEQRAAATIAGRSDLWYASFSGSGTQSNGYRLPSSFVPTAAENGARRENADSDDTVFVLRAGFTPNEDDEYAVNYYRQDGSKQDPPYAGQYLRTNTRLDGVTPRFWRWPWWNKESISLTSRNAIGGSGTLRLRAYYDTFTNSLESYDDATYTTQTRPFAFAGSRYDDYTVGGSTDFEWRWSESHVTRFAAHYKRDVHRELQRAPALPQQRLDIPTYDFAVEHEWLLTDALSLTPSYQHVIQSGRTVQVYGGGRFSPVVVEQSTADNGQLIGTYKLDDERSLVAGISRKTRFPTLKERFSGGLGSAVPNPALEPEYATHYEIGYEQAAAHGARSLPCSRATSGMRLKV